MAQTTDVLVAGYRDIDSATEDFERLVALVETKEVAIQGVIVRAIAVKWYRRTRCHEPRSWLHSWPTEHAGRVPAPHGHPA